VHKDIIIVGKNYPYYHEGLCQAALREMGKLVKENLNWHYSFKNQPYQDMMRFDSNEFVRFDLSRMRMMHKLDKRTYTWSKNRHKIICYTRMMYNDMICDHESIYWCYRNKVEKTLFLNLSGRATCVCCGEYIFDKWENPRNEEGSAKICNECLYHRSCTHCSKVYQRPELHLVEIVLNGGRYSSHERHLCKNELDKVRYYPGLGVALIQDGSYGDLDVYETDSGYLNPSDYWIHKHICKINTDALREIGIRGIYPYDREISQSYLENAIKEYRPDLSLNEVIELTRFKSGMTEEELKEVGVVK
jgi:hypothetical protein